MTKRQLGLLLILMGTVGLLGLILIDLLGAGGFRGIGPAQRLAMIAAGGTIVVGMTLLPLGDKPV
jgi:hypothetical protein